MRINSDFSNFYSFYFIIENKGFTYPNCLLHDSLHRSYATSKNLPLKDLILSILF